MKFTQAVAGAGATTGNVEYAGSYSPGNGPAGVPVQNVLFDPTLTLIMEFAGQLPGSGYDQLQISGTAALGGTLEIDLLNGFTPSQGESFEIFSGPTTGNFSRISLPPLANGLGWNTSNLDTTGTISVVPEPSALALLATGAAALAGCAWRRRRVRG